MLRYLTAGESHGPAMTAIVDGFPAGVPIDPKVIDRELTRRQGGYGRGGRQKLETDRITILSGTWNQVSLGSPLTLQVVNADAKLERLQDLPRPRPGHGDLSGSIKYLSSIRGILERASARETCVRVAAGAVARQLLSQFGIELIGFVSRIGPLALQPESDDPAAWLALRDRSVVYSLAPERDEQAIALIDRTRADGDTLGGVVEVVAQGVPFGLGSHAQWDLKLDARLARAVMSIQAIKGVEIGLGFAGAEQPGSQVHDPIQFDPNQRQSATLGFIRPTNRAGGIEAGMTNGQPIVLRAAMKPISTLQKPLESVDLQTGEPSTASYERSDITAVPACSVIVENVVAFELAGALIDKFGGDSLQEMQARYRLFQELATQR